jgi:hypothetical protein
MRPTLCVDGSSDRGLAAARGNTRSAKARMPSTFHFFELAGLTVDRRVSSKRSSRPRPKP